jgi:hypothetical protein
MSAIKLQAEQDCTELELNGVYYLKRQQLPTGTVFMQGGQQVTPTVYEEVSEEEQTVEVDINYFITCQSCIYYKVVGGRPHTRPK